MFADSLGTRGSRYVCKVLLKAAKWYSTEIIKRDKNEKKTKNGQLLDIISNVEKFLNCTFRRFSCFLRFLQFKSQF